MGNYIDKEYNNENIHNKRSKLTNFAKVLFISTVLVFFLVGAALGYNIYNNKEGKKIVKTEWGESEFDIPQSDEMINALVIGLDKGGMLTDTMMVVNYNPKNSNVNLISIPRDTIIGIRGSKVKLNSAFAYGKFDTTLSAIRELTGLPIHYYVAVDTKGFREVIDILGGVEFDVPQNMYYHDPYQNLKIDLKKGPQVLNGAKSEQLVRFRQYPTGDIQRTEVQRKFIKALIEQKLNLANISDIPKMKEIFDSLEKHVKTNISFNDAIKYVVSALKITPEKINNYTLPGEPRTIYGVSYYVYDKNKTLTLLSQLTNIDRVKLEKGMENSDKITTYDVNVINTIFPVREVIETVETEKTEFEDDKIEDNKIIEQNKTPAAGQVEPKSNPNNKVDDIFDNGGSTTKKPFEDNSSPTRNPFASPNDNKQDNSNALPSENKTRYF